MDKVIETESRCRDTLYIMPHKCIKIKSLGYICKYCGKHLIKLRNKEHKNNIKVT